MSERFSFEQEPAEPSYESRSEMDELALRTAHELSSIDEGVFEKESGPTGPIAERQKAAADFLSGKNETELLLLLDPSGKIQPELFSQFHLSTHPPGVIHIQLGTTEDLEKFYTLVGFHLNNPFAKAGIGDTREIDSFAATYLPPSRFGVDGFLGVITTIQGNIANSETMEKSIRHEYSHALVREAVRPVCQKRFSGKQLDESLEILLHPDTPENIRQPLIEKKIQDEQFLLDELRAYTFNFPPLPPKFPTTHLDLGEEDQINGISAEDAKKYFSVYLFHLQARLRSTQAKARSLGILGASGSLGQATRLLESDSTHWNFDPSETDEQFIARLWAVVDHTSDSEFMNFQHQEGGELVSDTEMKRQLIPSQTIVDAEITRRWGNLTDAPSEIRESYSILFPTHA